MQLFSSYGAFASKCASSYPVWGGDAWVPSVDDVCKARVRTNGIVEERYNIEGVDFYMYDVGGQRNERKKWIHCFEAVTAIMFVAAISEYDEVLFEDVTQNRLVESVTLFESISNSHWFKLTSIILFLTKIDLFKQKYVEGGVPLNTTGLFPTAPAGPPDYDDATEWLIHLFTKEVKDRDKAIFTHLTCATDTQNVKVVFDACTEIILKANLDGSSGFE